MPVGSQVHQRCPDLNDFVACCRSGRPHEERKESERFKVFDDADLVDRDEVEPRPHWR